MSFYLFILDTQLLKHYLHDATCLLRIIVLRLCPDSQVALFIQTLKLRATCGYPYCLAYMRAAAGNEHWHCYCRS